MKLSKETLMLIKNYASINSNLLLKPGNKLATKEPTGKIFSTSPIVEDFPIQFPIYDVNEFLSVYSLFENPNVDFNEKFLTITDGNASIKFFAAALETLVIPPDRGVNFGDIIVEFDLPASLLNTLLKTAPILKVQDISILGDGTTTSIIIADKKNPTSNSYSTAVGTTSKVFKVNVSALNLKMMSGDYVVKISQKGVQFVSKSSSLVYYVAIELDSVFE